MSNALDRPAAASGLHPPPPAAGVSVGGLSFTTAVNAPLWDGASRRGRYQLPTLADLATADLMLSLGLRNARVLCFEPVEDGVHGAGPVDAIAPALEQERRHLADGREWTIERCRVSHTRCTVLRIEAFSQASAERVSELLENSEHIYVPPRWAAVKDTAAAVELMAEFPDERGDRTILLGSTFETQSGGGQHCFWLAVPKSLLRQRLRPPPAEPKARRTARREPEPRCLRVGVVALGTIGKRVAEAVEAQPDMTLQGVVLQSAVAAVLPLLKRGVKIYGLDDQAALMDAQIHCEGLLTDLLRGVDVIVDCGLRGTGATRAPLYRASGVKAVFQGGEPRDLAGSDFCATINFEQALGLQSVRVASCNSTGMARLLSALRESGVLENVHATITRCATDRDKAGKGTTNGLIVQPGRSHHADDVRRLMLDVPLHTLAAHAATNRGHLIHLFVRFQSPVTTAAVEAALSAASRVLLVSSGEVATTDLQRIGRGPRADCHSVVVWRESIEIDGQNLTLSAGIPMEAIVIPDTIDAIRALGAPHIGGAASRKVTDIALGVHSGAFSIKQELER